MWIDPSCTHWRRLAGSSVVLITVQMHCYARTCSLHILRVYENWFWAGPLDLTKRVNKLQREWHGYDLRLRFSAVCRPPPLYVLFCPFSRIRLGGSLQPVAGNLDLFRPGSYVYIQSAPLWLEYTNGDIDCSISTQAKPTEIMDPD